MNKVIVSGMVGILAMSSAQSFWDFSDNLEGKGTFEMSMKVDSLYDTAADLESNGYFMEANKIYHKEYLKANPYSID